MSKSFIGSHGGHNFAIKIEGVDPGFLNLPFGVGLDTYKVIGAFTATAKSYHVGAKGKATLAAVKKWLKEEKPSHFYAKWQVDSDNWKDDSVHIFYTPSDNGHE